MLRISNDAQSKEIVMRRILREDYLRSFIGGFGMGALALFAFQPALL